MTEHAYVYAQHEQRQQNYAVAHDFRHIYGYALFEAWIVRREINIPNYAASVVTQMVMKIRTHVAVCVGNLLFYRCYVQFC